MKILAISNLYPPNVVGGYERLVAQIVEALAHRGHDVHVLTSDYGDPVTTEDSVRVTRALKLLTSRDNVYAPFDGTAEDRERIHAQNVSAVRTALASVAPDLVFVGNLHFLDASVMRVLDEMGDRCVSLLTDVWRINLENPTFLGSYFRDQVLGSSTGTPLVPPDPAALVVDPWRDDEPDVAYVEGALIERARRRRWERVQARGRSVYTYDGICVLCGPTVHLVERKGPADTILRERPRDRCMCCRCELDAEVRAGLHLLAEPPEDAARPSGGDPGREPGVVFLHAPDAVFDAVRRALGDRVIRDVPLRGASTRVEGALFVDVDEAQLRATLTALAPDVRVAVVRAASAPVSAKDDILADLARLRSSGRASARATSVWSPELGYVGETLYVATAHG